MNKIREVMMTKNKLARIKKISSLYRRGCYNTFWNTLNSIPDYLKDRLTAKEIAVLMGAIYKAYEKGYFQGVEDCK